MVLRSNRVRRSAENVRLPLRFSAFRGRWPSTRPGHPADFSLPQIHTTAASAVGPATSHVLPPVPCPITDWLVTATLHCPICPVHCPTPPTLPPRSPRARARSAGAGRPPAAHQGSTLAIPRRGIRSRATRPPHGHDAPSPSRSSSNRRAEVSRRFVRPSVLVPRPWTMVWAGWTSTDCSLPCPRVYSPASFL
jgi:hypothetical protein